MLTQIIVFGTVFLFFFMLLRESIIDLKIEYVPNNILIESYSIAIVFLIVYALLTQSFTVIKNGLITFGIVFVFALTIAGVSYIKALIEVKRIKKGSETIEIQEDDKKAEPIVIEVESEESSLSKFLNKYKKIIFTIYGLILILALSFLQNMMPVLLFNGILMTGLILAIISHSKTGNIDVPCKIIGLSFALIFAATKFMTKDKNLIVVTIIAFVLAYIVELIYGNLLHKKFYENGDQLVDEKGFLLPEDQQPQPENPDAIENHIDFSIGGGDLFIFGAMGLMIGTIGLIEIFVNMAFVQLFFMIGFCILNRNKKSLPLVPAIATAFILYFSGISIISLTDILQAFVSSF